MASIEVLNATQANVEAPVEIQLSLGNPIYRGPEGKPGKDGVIGRDGKSAYEIAVENGFEGTETEWLESLKGADGTIGRDGAVGPQGEKGDTPVKGVDYFTEQDIEDFIAQVPQPDLSKYREIINIVWSDIIPDDDLIKLRAINDELANKTYDNRYVIFVGNRLVIGVQRGYKNNNCPDLIIFNNDKFFKYTPSNYNSDSNQVYYYSGQYVNLDASYITVLKNSAVSPVSQSLDTQFAYIKNQYATKAYVEEVVRGIETGALKRAVVEELPTEKIDENTIYMMPKTGSLNDAYNEYLYIENAWEHIGSTDVDLTGYATEQYVDNGLANKQSNLIAGTGITLSGSTISVNTQYLTNSDILAIWNGENN